MNKAIDVVQQAYEAYGRRDIPAILEFVAHEVDWEFVGSAHLSYAGRRHTRNEVADFFAMLARTEDFHVFEPREFIEAGEHVTVLGWAKATGFDTQKTAEGEWVQVFTVKEGKITRWRGFANTAARYGM
jgi:uncharacterized protein